MGSRPRLTGVGAVGRGKLFYVESSSGLGRAIPPAHGANSHPHEPPGRATGTCPVRPEYSTPSPMKMLPPTRAPARHSPPATFRARSYFGRFPPPRHRAAAAPIVPHSPRTPLPHENAASRTGLGPSLPSVGGCSRCDRSNCGTVLWQSNDCPRQAEPNMSTPINAYPP